MGRRGASWLFETLKVGDEYSLPTTRYIYLKFMAYDSPIISRLPVQVHEWISTPRGNDGLPNRVVIMATMPWAQQDLCIS